MNNDSVASAPIQLPSTSALLRTVASAPGLNADLSRRLGWALQIHADREITAKELAMRIATEIFSLLQRYRKPEQADKRYELIYVQSRIVVRLFVSEPAAPWIVREIQRILSDDVVDA